MPGDPKMECRQQKFNTTLLHNLAEGDWIKRKLTHVALENDGLTVNVTPEQTVQIKTLYPKIYFSFGREDMS